MTERLGYTIGQMLEGGETLALIGMLGAGKTTLVRGIARGCGAGSRDVSSPTFVLIHEYRGRLPFVHVDLYRLEDQRDIESTGLADYLSGPTVTAIEWADRGATWLPSDRLEIELRHRTVKSRTVQLRARGRAASALLQRTKARWQRTASSAEDRKRRPSKKATAR